MARKETARSKHKYFSDVAWLDRHDFDLICEHKIQYDGSRYRLEREPTNRHDKNAIVVYVNQFIIGYLYKEVASVIAPLMDRGDVFTVQHDRSSNNNGYRYLTVRIYNESAIARESGIELDEQTAFDMMAIHSDPDIRGKPKYIAPVETSSYNTFGCICMVLAGLIFIYIFTRLLG